MSITAIIVDDEQLAREELQYLLDGAGEVEVLAQGTNGIEAVELIRNHRPDIVFLDVQMPGLDGFAVIKKLRTRVLQAIERAHKRVEENAGGKTAAELTNDPRLDTLLRLIEQSPAGRPSRGKIIVQAQNRLLLVDQAELCFASIEEGTITVATPSFEGQSRCRTLEELLEQLDPSLFWRAHRSYVVNINHIKEVVPWFKSSYQLRMGDRKHSAIPVSRAQTRRLRELFNL